MNRREVLKTAGAAIAASVLPGAASESRAGTAGARQSGAVTLSIRGASLLRFPKDGSSAELKFIGVAGNPDPIPVHLPWLMIGNDVECVTAGHSGRRKWLVAGHEILPEMGTAWTVPTGYDEVPDYKTKAVWTPAGGDWSSLIWIPTANIVVDSTREAEGTSAVLKMRSGTLKADKPHHTAAEKYLWIWATPSEWIAFEPSLSTAPQTSITDQLALSGTYSGTFKIALTSVATGASTTLEFRPTGSGKQVNIALVAEPTHGQQPVRPLSLYSGYYNLEAPPKASKDRKAPYLSPVGTDGVVHGAGAGSGASAGMLTPRPLCGALKIVG